MDRKRYCLRSSTNKYILFIKKRLKPIGNFPDCLLSIYNSSKRTERAALFFLEETEEFCSKRDWGILETVSHSAGRDIACEIAPQTYIVILCLPGWNSAKCFWAASLLWQDLLLQKLMYFTNVDCLARIGQLSLQKCFRTKFSVPMLSSYMGKSNYHCFVAVSWS